MFYAIMDNIGYLVTRASTTRLSGGMEALVLEMSLL